MTYAQFLQTIRSQRRWAFVRVPIDGSSRAAELHYWIGPSVSDEEFIEMMAHELGHLSGDILDDDRAEEERADTYSRVCLEVIKLLLKR